MEVAKEKEKCREVEIVDGHEFICTLDFHGREVDNNGNKQPWNNSRGAPSKWRRHFFQRRYLEGDH